MKLELGRQEGEINTSHANDWLIQAEVVQHFSSIIYAVHRHCSRISVSNDANK